MRCLYLEHALGLIKLSLCLDHALVLKIVVQTIVFASV